MTVVPGVTVCPDCSAELEPTGSDDGRPLQCVHQQCPNCGWTATLGLVWYPTGVYDVVGELGDDVDESCEYCPDDPSGVVVSSGTNTPVYYCSACLRGHHRRALERTEVTS